MGVIVGEVCACVFCWVASVLSWHAKVEEELVVSEILSTTTNLFMGLSYKRCFFLWHAKWKEFECPFDYNKFMGVSYKQIFFYDMQNAKHLRALLTITNLWDWVINDVFFEDMQNAKHLRALLTTTHLWDEL
jgi:hypothetical protein